MILIVEAYIHGGLLNISNHMNRCCFIIFAHSLVQDVNDLNDMIDNISYFHDNCDFIVNHPTIDHPKIRTRHMPGVLNHSSFIFGAYEKVLRSLSEEEINSFDHFCLVSANQYFINKIEFEKGVNYVTFYNIEHNWHEFYNGYKFSKEVIGFPLNQYHGRWDPKDLYIECGIKTTPMPSNWECLTLTKEAMLLAKENIDLCVKIYPDLDMISIFPGYMALLSGQPWEFPKHFGSYDPSNTERTHFLTDLQIDNKYNEGYYSLKRTDYKKNCFLKQYIRKEYMK